MDENTDSCLAAVRPSRSALPQAARFPAPRSRTLAIRKTRRPASLQPPKKLANHLDRASRVTSHFFTATPYPIAPPSSAIPVALAASGNLHPDRPSTFRSLLAWPSPLRGDSISLRQTAPAALQHFAVRDAIPVAPLLSPHPSRALAASFA